MLEGRFVSLMGQGCPYAGEELEKGVFEVCRTAKKKNRDRDGICDESWRKAPRLRRLKGGVVVPPGKGQGAMKSDEAVNR